MAIFTVNSAVLDTISPAEKLFNFLINFENFATILPQDKAESFSCTATSCTFNIKGITPMTVVLKNQIPNSRIEFSTEGLGKFNFTLVVKFDDESANSCKSSIELTGDLQPLIKAMAEKPLAALVESMNQKLSNLKLD